MTALGTPPAHRSGSGAKRALHRAQTAAVLDAIANIQAGVA